MAKTILGSVGKGGKNRFEDVVTVQYLLNCVPAKRGGPEKELVLDGLCGPLTTGAISRYQLAHLGFADGRVDAGGKTIQLLGMEDPYPNQDLNLPSVRPGHAKSHGKKGGTPSANAWDPWGYYNPAGDNYMKDGKQPPSKMGGGSKSHEGIKHSGQQAASGGGGGWGQGGWKDSGGKWTGGGNTSHEGIKQSGKQTGGGGGWGQGGWKDSGGKWTGGGNTSHEGIKQTGQQAGGGWWDQLTSGLKGLGQKDGGMPESMKGYGKGGGGIVGKF